MQRFLLPLSLREFTISLFWHPRLDADPSNKWLRSVVHDVCAKVASLGNESQTVQKLYARALMTVPGFRLCEPSAAATPNHVHKTTRMPRASPPD